MRERTRAETRGRARDGREGAFGAFAFAFAYGGVTVSEGTCDAKAEDVKAAAARRGAEGARAPDVQRVDGAVEDIHGHRARFSARGGK